MYVRSSAGQHPTAQGSRREIKSASHTLNQCHIISEASALPMQRIAVQLSLEKWNSKLKKINTLFHYISFNESVFLNVFVE